jgi:hypothetical protein
MDESKPIAADFLIIGKQMKDQEKRKPEDDQIVKDATCWYYTHLLEKHPATLSRHQKFIQYSLT